MLYACVFCGRKLGWSRWDSRMMYFPNAPLPRLDLSLGRSKKTVTNGHYMANSRPPTGLSATVGLSRCAVWAFTLFHHKRKRLFQFPPRTPNVALGAMPSPGGYLLFLRHSARNGSPFGARAAPTFKTPCAEPYSKYGPIGGFSWGRR